jgi:hypothetical protein
MILDADVVIVARRFGVDPVLLQAVVKAEGDILKAVRCSLPETKDRAAALDILARSAVHALSDYVKRTDPQGFVVFWGKRWAPVGADNDPLGLNVNWTKNVYRLWDVKDV